MESDNPLILFLFISSAVTLFLIKIKGYNKCQHYIKIAENNNSVYKKN